MARLSIREATFEDVAYVADNLRAADVVEIRMQKLEPAGAVRNSFRISRWTKVVLVDDKPAVIYGLAPTAMPEMGSPWMVATEAIKAVGYKFLRQSCHERDRMKDEYSVLFNQVHRGNKVSIAWLRWLGFVIDPKPTGPQGQFLNFWTGG